MTFLSTIQLCAIRLCMQSGSKKISFEFVLVLNKKSIFVQNVPKFHIIKCSFEFVVALNKKVFLYKTGKRFDSNFESKTILKIKLNPKETQNRVFKLSNKEFEVPLFLKLWNPKFDKELNEEMKSNLSKVNSTLKGSFRLDAMSLDCLLFINE